MMRGTFAAVACAAVLCCRAHVAGAPRGGDRESSQSAQIDMATQRRLHMAQKMRDTRERAQYRNVHARAAKLREQEATRTAELEEQEAKRKQAEEERANTANAERQAKEEKHRRAEELRHKEREARDAVRHKEIMEKIVERRRFVQQQSETIVPQMDAGDGHGQRRAMNDAVTANHAHRQRDDAEHANTLETAHGSVERVAQIESAPLATGESGRAAPPAGVGVVQATAQMAGTAPANAADESVAIGHDVGIGGSCALTKEDRGGAGCMANAELDSQGLWDTMDAEHGDEAHDSYYHQRYAEQLHDEQLHRNREMVRARREQKRVLAETKASKRAVAQDQGNAKKESTAVSSSALHTPPALPTASTGKADRVDYPDANTHHEERRAQMADARRSTIQDALALDTAVGERRASMSATVLVPAVQTTANAALPAATESELLDMASAVSETMCSSHDGCSDQQYCTQELVCQARPLCTPSPGFPHLNPVDGLCTGAPAVLVTNNTTIHTDASAIDGGSMTVAAMALRAGPVVLSTTLVAGPCVELVRVQLTGTKINTLTFVYVDGSEAAWTVRDMATNQDSSGDHLAAKTSTAEYHIERGRYIQQIKTREAEDHGLSGMQFVTNTGEASPWYGHYTGRFRLYATEQPSGSEVWGLLPSKPGHVLAIRERQLNPS